MNESVQVLDDDRVQAPETLRRTDEDLRLPAIAPRESYPIDIHGPEARQQTNAVGQRVTRLDVRLHSLGQTQYIGDLAFPGMPYAKIKRAGIASARILHIDTSAAEAMPGVMAVMTGSEIPVNSFGPSYQDQPVLADEREFHAGDGVAAVAAVTEQIAAEAIDRIVVEYEPLPAVFDPIAAMQDGAVQVHAPDSNIYTSKNVKATLRRALPSPIRFSRARSALR